MSAIEQKNELSSAQKQHRAFASEIADKVAMSGTTALSASLQNHTYQHRSIIQKKPGEDEELPLQPMLIANQNSTLQAFKHVPGNKIQTGPGKQPFVQTKLSINAPGDQYDQEADAMADKVMLMTDASLNQPVQFNLTGAAVQRKCAACEEENDIHRKESPDSETPANSSLDNYVSSLSSSGQTLPESSRRFFEPRFGQDFSNVKIHTDSIAAKSAQSINALAFATGNNIVFNQGQYAPDSESGQRLIAHELTHVVQQSNRKRIQRDPIAANLKLPCKWGDLSFEEQKVAGIRFLMALVEPERKVLPPITDIAARITTDNAVITDEKFKVKTCIIAASNTRFSLYKGEPILAIDPTEPIRIINHEMGHAVFNFLIHTTGNRINKQINQHEFVANLTDVFLQLSQIVLNKGKVNEIKATSIVDPSEWNPGTKREHPNDVDEFFASAKEAFQINKKALTETFEKYGKQEKSVLALGKRLVSLMTFLFAKGELKKKQSLSSSPDAIKEQLGGVSELPNYGDTVSHHLNIDKLLNPDKRKDCK